MPPNVVGPYRIIETLGSGGVGTVYRAEDRRSGELVALKLLSTGPALDPRAARRLAREFEALVHLSHPHVVRVIDTGVHQGYPYLAMELVEGLTLREYLSLHGSPDSDSGSRPYSLRPPPLHAADALTMSGESAGVVRARAFSLSAFSEEAPSEEISVPFQSGPDSVRRLADDADEPDTLETSEITLPYDLPSPEAFERFPSVVNLLEINQPERVGRLKDAMMQLSEALSYVHAHGLIHRDLKPSNVMVDEDRQVRLMDFGLAKFLADDSGVTGTGRMVGTFRYMAPEQILGEPLDARSDLYSLGVILYELLAGKPPYDARTPSDLWHMVLEKEPMPLTSLNAKADAQLARIAHRLIRKEPYERYQTAEEVFEALAE